MSIDPQVLIVIAGMALVTYLPRLVPMLVLTRRRLPPVVEQWLRLLPPAVLGALLAQALFLPDGQPLREWTDPTLLAAVPTALIGWKTRHLGFTVLIGLATVALLRAAGG